MKLNPPKMLELVEEVILDDEKERAKKPYVYRHNPSSSTAKREDGTVVGACLRQLWMKSKAFPISNPKKFTTKLQAGFGNAIHTWFAEQLSKSKKITFVAEAAGKILVEPLTKEVSFRLDGLVTHRGELGCFELKTVQTYGLQKMLKENSGLPKPSDILQVLDYFGTNNAIMWASLVYVARDTAMRCEFHIWKDDEDGKFYIKGIVPEVKTQLLAGPSFEKVVERWKELEGYIERDEMPKRDFKVVYRDGEIVPNRTKIGVDYKTDFQCLYCPYMNGCWSLAGAKEDSYQVRGDKS